MKNTWNALAIVLSVVLAIPSLVVAQDSNPPEGYLPAGQTGQVQDDASNAAPTGYLPPGKAQNAAVEDEIARAKADGFAPAPSSVSNAESVDGGRLMILAYIGFWLIALGYIATLAQRARRTGREVVELHRQVQELDDRMEDIEVRTSA